MVAPTTTLASDPGRPLETSSANVLEIVRRRAVLIALSVLLCAGVAAAFSLLRDDRYEASTQMLFGGAGPEIQLLGGQVNFGGNDERQVANNAALLRSRRVAEAAARRLQPMTAEQVAAAINVAADQQADVVTVTATGKSRDAAARIANAYAATFRDLQVRQQSERAAAAREVLTDRLRSLDAAARAGGEGQSLRARIAQLRALERVGTGSPQIIDVADAADATRTGGRLPVTIAVGALLGLLLGLALAFLREQLDARLRRADDLEDAFEAPLLATVPRSRAIERGAPLSQLEGADGEAFRTLAAKLRFGGAAGAARSILVTSAREGEGKTTLAWYLACAMAASGLDVMLVEADLRRPDLRRRLGLEGDLGLADVLGDRSQLDRALQRVSLGAPGGSEAPAVLDVLPAGSAPHGVAGLMQSSGAGDLVEALSGRYDVVIVDTPAIGGFGDAIPLARRVDAILVAARLGVTARADAATVRTQLEDLGAPARGVVAADGPPAGRRAAGARVPAGRRGLGVRRRLAVVGVLTVVVAAAIVAVATSAGDDGPGSQTASRTTTTKPARDPASYPSCRAAASSAGKSFEGTCRTSSAVLTLADAPGPLVLPSLWVRLDGARVLRAQTADGRRRRRVRVTVRLAVRNAGDRPLTFKPKDPELYLYLPSIGRRTSGDPRAAERVPGSLRASGPLAPGASRTGTVRFELAGPLTQAFERRGGADLGVRLTSAESDDDARTGVIHFSAP